MEKRVRVIDFGKKFGNMNTGAKFYPDGMSIEDRRKDFLDRRIKVGEYYGFDGHKMYCCDQLTKNGSSFEITEDYVRENPNGWSDIKEDILIITDKVPGVVIGHPIADCPVVMMTDRKRGISAIAHCGAELIDKKLPMMIADSLIEYGCRDEDIYTYVSACAGKDWTYDSYPRWANDKELWKEGIIYENGVFKIDMRSVIHKQLIERNIGFERILFNPIDTITNNDYYSNSAASPNGLNRKDKSGRNFAGLFYPEDNALQYVRK